MRTMFWYQGGYFLSSLDSWIRGIYRSLQRPSCEGKTRVFCRR